MLTKSKMMILLLSCLARLLLLSQPTNGFLTSSSLSLSVNSFHYHLYHHESPMTPKTTTSPTTTSTSLNVFKSNSSNMSPEDLRRRKLVQIKRKRQQQKKFENGGDINDDFSYQKKIQQKLGKQKTQMMLGSTIDDDDDEVEENDIEFDNNNNNANDDPLSKQQQPMGRLGSLEKAPEPTMPPLTSASTTPELIQLPRPKQVDSGEQKEMSEQELVDLVAQKLHEKEKAKAAEAAAAAMASSKAKPTTTTTTTTSSSATATTKTTSGVGGTWDKPQNDSNVEVYQPKSTSWGAFPRPKDISKAYGGGRRVGAGYSNEQDSDTSTSQLLQRYRQKMGIDVPSENEHKQEIEEALKLSQLAMQRGMYSTAVSALEKVTQWCSTNSKVGSQIYLELAMAYEAVGRTKEAYQVYSTLSKSRMEQVAQNAKRLLYGMEAMEFMRETVGNEYFSQKQVHSEFIKATGFDDMAKHFDDRYVTAYVDMNSNAYKRLTENVVRSPREARQIVLQACRDKDSVDRMKIVQALRSISRQFQTLLEKEQEQRVLEESSVMIDGKPLNLQSSSTSTSELLEEFVTDPDLVKDNLQKTPTWRLMFLADQKGDRVSFYNSTIATQSFNEDDSSFVANGPYGLTSMVQTGNFEFDPTTRIISRQNLDTTLDGGSFFGNVLSAFSTNSAGFARAVSSSFQIINADSILLITKYVEAVEIKSDSTAGIISDTKEHFGVWSRYVDDENNIDEIDDSTTQQESAAMSP